MPDESSPIIEFKNVSLRFDEVWALRDVSLTLHPGETRIIFGSAGSGKTTLLKAVIGLVQADEGEVLLFGRNLCCLKEEELLGLRSHAGFLFQEGGLFDSVTIGENVAYPLLNRRDVGGGSDESESEAEADGADPEKRVREALRFVELEQSFGQFPSEVSGGMRRRVGIARAIVTEPPLILYDSPTAGLDPITANLIMALIAKERDTRNIASLIVTHRYQDGELMANFYYDAQKQELQPIDEDDPGRGQNGTKFIVMKEGQIVFFGSRREMESSEDEYVKKFVRREK